MVTTVAVKTQHDAGLFRMACATQARHASQQLNGILPSQIIPCDVECIRNMLHGCTGSSIVLNQDHVKSTGAIVKAMLCEILRGQLNELGAFARIHGFDCAAIGA